MTSQVSKRWWAPAGDKSVDELLRPGAKPDLDLGLALLGLHRAGAEACELVARTALADETVLIAALAQTRAIVAPQAQGTISKAVGGPTYAGLLLRDLLDDAENAALSLYRSCLAKSMSPPLAAQRVGMVYGVPSRELNRYAALATDPKSPPVAVQDMADRVLFDFVAKVSAEEGEQAKETVSKAPTQDFTPDDPSTPYYDGRSHGRFARAASKTRQEVLPGISLDDLLNPVTTGPAEVAVPAPERKTPQRMKRMGRMKRLTPTRSSAEPLKAKTLGAKKLKAQSLSATKLSARALMAQDLTSRPTAVAPAPAPQGLVGSDLTARLPDLNAGEHYDVHDVALVMSPAEFERLRRLAKKVDQGGLVMRWGRAAEQLTVTPGVTRYRDQESGEITNTHDDAVDFVHEDWRYRAENSARPDAVHVEVTPDQMRLLEQAIGQPEARERRLAQMKLEFLEDLYAHDPGMEQLGLNPRSEIVHVKSYAVFGSPEEMVLVYQPPVSSSMDDRELPEVVELIAREASGSVEETKYGEDIVVDPNMPVVFYPGRKPRGYSPEDANDERSFYDVERGIVRRAVYLHLSDDIEKADSGYLAAHNEGQDAQGRFFRIKQEVLPGVTLDDLLSAKPKESPVSPPARMKRMQRMQHKAKAPAALSARPFSARTLSAVQLSANSLRVQALSRRAHVEQDPYADLLHLDDSDTYTVISPVRLEQMRKGKRHGFAEDESENWHLDPTQQRLFLQAQTGRGSATEVELQTQAMNVWNGRVAGPMNKYKRRLGTQKVSDHDDTAELGRVLAQFDGAEVTFSRRGNDIVLAVSVPGESLGTFGVVRHGYEDVDADAEHELIPGETKRVHNAATITHWLDMNIVALNESSQNDITETFMNPQVKTWYDSEG